MSEIEKKKDSIGDFLLGMEKAEIHLHVEGLVSVDTIWELMIKNNIKYDDIKTKEDIKNKFSIKTLEEFLYLFINIIQNSFRTEDDVKLLVRDAGEYLRANNIVYAELFLAPTKLVKMGLDFKKIVEIMDEGARQVKKIYNIDMKFIIDVSRTFGIENAMNNLNLTINNKVPSVIGIGLGGSEINGPAREYKEVFDKARAHGLHIVAHAGEDAGPESVWDTINYLQAERIGHGISSILDEKLMDYLSEKQIPIEVCPSSNLFTRKYVKNIREHPVKTFFNKGMKVTINSDDPTLFSTNLIDEYKILYGNNIFTKDEIIVLINNTIDATFLSGKEKELLKERNKAKEIAASG
jgi:adenosine deaminase